MNNNFEDLVWLFQCDNRNRNIIRQNFDEAALLWKMCKKSSGPILEIGRKSAGSTVLLLMACGDRDLTSIDIDPKHHPLCDQFIKQIQNKRNNIDIITADSRIPIKNKEYGLIFIDGDHSYDGVLADVSAHWNSLKAFDNCPPIVVFHDSVPNKGLQYNNQINYCEGVKRLCNQLINNKYASIIESAGSSIALMKLSDLPLPLTFNKFL